jgi:hypothetical protein
MASPRVELAASHEKGDKEGCGALIPQGRHPLRRIRLYVTERVNTDELEEKVMAQAISPMRRGSQKGCPAILFIVFKRPDTTRHVMQTIRSAQPARLYVAGDGPRDRPGELALCEETRAIATMVDWPCEVRTLWRDSNLGCRIGVSSAIDWFFSHEEEGIILEDDCAPSPSFFLYCSELLERYRTDNRVMCISGTNFQDGRSVTPDSYYFSRYMHCWGWASWRRAWRHYDRDMSLWPEFLASGGLRAWSGGDPLFERHWRNILQQMFRGEIDTWDYQWLFACWAQGGLTCAPAKNLVRNIGFGDGATHTSQADHRLARLVPAELEFPLIHPRMILRNTEADRWEDRHAYGIRRMGLKKRMQSLTKEMLSLWAR